MPSIVISEKGYKLFYEDSGAPTKEPEARYTTLMLVHGTGFHGAIFKRLIPLASKHNLRLVLINRRDYPGSSPYTEEELSQLRSSDDDAHMQFAIDRGQEFATFVQKFIMIGNLKEPLEVKQPDGSTKWGPGGVVILGWSAGNVYILPLLAFADKISPTTREKIEPYLKSMIIFDSPCALLGRRKSIEEILSRRGIVVLDNSKPFEERYRLFGEWVGAYYTHSSLTSHNTLDLEVGPKKGNEVNTMSNIGVEELEEMTDFVAAERSELSFRTAKPSDHIRRVRKAVFDDRLANYFPRCGVDVIWGENSTCEAVETTWGFEEEREKASRDGIKGRRLRILMMPGANHFPHWDKPEETIEFFARAIASASTAADQNAPNAITDQTEVVQEENRRPLYNSHIGELRALPAPAYRRRPSTSPERAPLTRKRRWESTTVDPSQVAAVSASSGGLVNPSSKIKEMMAESDARDGQDDDLAVELPPSKRRKGLAGSVISSAFNAALIGAAVGLTVFRMWTNRGKESEQPPPPPYQEEWAPSAPAVISSEESKPQLVPSQTQRNRPTSIPSRAKRHVTSAKHRPKVRRVVRSTRESSPRKQPTTHLPHVEQVPIECDPVVDHEEDDSKDKDEMDWIGDKLARLIEEGKRALGTEIVVSSEAPEDEVDDGSGDWIEEDPLASASFSSDPFASPSQPQSKAPSTPSRIPRYKGINNNNSITAPPSRSISSMQSRYTSNNLSASASSSPKHSKSFSMEFNSARSPSLFANDETESLSIRESMERARAAYRQRKGL